jgi:hypothetical protein
MPRAARLLLALVTSIAVSCSGGGGSSGGPTVPTYTISGTVTKADGSPLAGASVVLDGPTRHATTDAHGKYSFTVRNGTYNLSVSSTVAGTDYWFNPSSLQVTVSGAAVTTNTSFVATALPGGTTTHKLSGTIAKAWGGNLAGVTVTLTGVSAGTPSSPSTFATGADGTYAFGALPDGDYTLGAAAALADYVFTPSVPVSLTLTGADRTQDFSADGAFAISGTVTTAWGTALAGVSVSLAGGGVVKGAATTDGSGHYTIQGIPNGSYTLTPALAGYVITPATVAVSGGSATKDFTADGAYTISGTITKAWGGALQGVSVALTGGDTRPATTTDANGQYFFRVPNGSFTVTPTLASWALTPAAPTVVVSGADKTRDFTADGAYTISGNISKSWSGALQGVSVSLTGTGGAGAGIVKAAVLTNSSGNYTISGVPSGTYTVTPTLASWAIAAGSVNVTTANATKDFTADGAYQIGGNISGLQLSGVSVSLVGTAGAGLGIVKPASVTASVGGYSFTGIPNGTYTVTPSKAGWTFTPSSASVVVNGSSVTQNFTDTATLYKLDVHVAGAPATGVTLRLSGDSTGTATTNAAGDYTFHVASGAYRVTPSMEGYAFDPADSGTVNVSLADTSTGFTATPTSSNPTISVTGTIAYGGLKTGRVFVTAQWQNQGGGSPAAGTSLAAPGTFSFVVQAPGGFPPGGQTLTIRAWMDTSAAPGMDKCNGDSPRDVVPVLVQSTDAIVSAGTITLTDPLPGTPPAPGHVNAMPGNQGAAVIFDTDRDADGCFEADNYVIYYSTTTTSPGPGTASTRSFKVPPGPGFGIVYDLTNGTSAYLSLTAMRGANESAATQLGAALPVGQYTPPSSHNVTGTVSFPAVPTVPSSVYLYAQTFGGHGGPTNIVRVAIPTTSTTSLPFSMPLPNGTYGLGAFVEIGNKGYVNTNDPGLFGGDVPVAQVTVSGADAAVTPTIPVPATSSVASVSVSHGDWGGGPGDSLSFKVDSARKNPIAVRVTAGPNLPVPVDIGLSADGGGPGMEYRGSWGLSPAAATVGDLYTLHVSYSDGSAEDLNRPITATFTSVPGIVSPELASTVATTNPTFQWTAPSPPPSGTYYYFINVWSNGGGNNNFNWGPIPSSQTSIDFATLSGGQPLSPGQYSWNIQATDSNNNSTSAQGNFKAVPPRSISGQITKAWGGALQGVTVTLAGDASSSVQTDSSGKYTFGNLGDGHYTVQPALAGYTFGPPGAVSIDISGSGKIQDFSADGAYQISGTVSKAWSGVFQGVSVTLTGGDTRPPTLTDGNGQYFFRVPNGSFTVTPTLAGWAFTPASPTVVVSGADKVKDFSANGAYTISGTITGAQPAGVSVALVGVSGDGVGIVKPSPTTLGAGTYAFSGIPNGTYNVTPTLGGYAFTPSSASVLVAGAAVVQNFTDAVKQYLLSVHVAGAPSSGVTLRLTGSKTDLVQTDGSGDYTFNLPAGSYTVTASMAGYNITANDTWPLSLSGDVSTSFTAIASGPGGYVPVITVTGTIAYGGGKSGRVFLNAQWPNNGGDAAAGTSLAGPGPFTLHVQARGGFPDQLNLKAWMDTSAAPGMDKCTGGSPRGSVSNVAVDGGTVDVGTITLSDPPVGAPAAPSEVDPMPATSAVGAIVMGASDAFGCDTADSYVIYYSTTTTSPGPLTARTNKVTVPAGPGFGIVYGLVNGTSVYMSATAMRGGAESAATQIQGSPVPVGLNVPPSSQNVTGTVTFPAVPTVPSSLYVFGQSAGNNNGPVNLVRIPITSTSTTSLAYTLPLPNGTYSLGAFLEIGNKGYVNTNDPGLSDSQTPGTQVTVNGSPVGAPTFALPGAGAVASVTTEHQEWGGGSNDSLSFEVSGARKNPIFIQVTAGPNVLVPIDVGLSMNGGGPGVHYGSWWSLYPTRAMAGDPYTLHVVYSDGTSEDLHATVTAAYANAPTAPSPADGSTGVSKSPTFTWTAPSPTPAGSWWYYVNVWPNGGGNGWDYGPIDPGQTSISFATISGGASLSGNAQYGWRIEAVDANGNRMSSSANFTTGP